MKLHVSHTTEYKYSTPVDYALQKVRLRPLTSAFQDVLDWKVEITGGKVETQYLDHYRNHVDLVSLTPNEQKISFKASGTIKTHVSDGVLGMVYDCAPLWHFLQPTLLTTPGPKTIQLSKDLVQSKSNLDGLHALSQAILESVPYKLGVTDANTSAEDALLAGFGVCQDHTHIFLTAARLAGIPARYVSGYLMMNETINQDATHAWAEAHIEDLGWVGFDVSNGYSQDERYVRIAVGCDARDASPISGLRIGDSDETLIVSLQVQQ